MLPVKLRILFLCTGNSCRSQMAEGWARALKEDAIQAYSAGIETRGLNPNAVKVMAEAGVDISGHRSKNVESLRDVPFDYVVTVCGHANESCPLWLGGKTKVVHVGFDDPPALAKSAKNEEEALNHYRRVRDEIAAFVRTLPESLAGSCSETTDKNVCRTTGRNACPTVHPSSEPSRNTNHNSTGDSHGML
jgi:arsenate reductase (thioredoxin)